AVDGDGRSGGHRIRGLRRRLVVSANASAQIDAVVPPVVVEVGVRLSWVTVTVPVLVGVGLGEVPLPRSVEAGNVGARRVIVRIERRGRHVGHGGADGEGRGPATADGPGRGSRDGRQ